MNPTLQERRELAQEFAANVARMQFLLEQAGHGVSTDDVVRAWSRYSQDHCAIWLGAPDEEADIVAILLHYLSLEVEEEELWPTTLVAESGEREGGGLSLPDELVTRLGWQEGERLQLIRDDAGPWALVRTK